MRLAEADDLVSTARQLLLEQLLSQLPENARYQALMVANGLAIAHRQIAAGALNDEQALLLRALQTFYPDAPACGLDAIYLRLRQELRDVTSRINTNLPERQRLWGVLHELTLGNLAVSNPKVLQRR